MCKKRKKNTHLTDISQIASIASYYFWKKFVIKIYLEVKSKWTVNVHIYLSLIKTVYSIGLPISKFTSRNYFYILS